MNDIKNKLAVMRTLFEKEDILYKIRDDLASIKSIDIELNDIQRSASVIKQLEQEKELSRFFVLFSFCL